MPRLIFRQSTVRQPDGSIQTDEPVTLQWFDSNERRRRVTDDLSPAQMALIRQFLASDPLVRSWHLHREDPAATVAVGRMRDGEDAPVFTGVISAALRAHAATLMGWAEQQVTDYYRPLNDDYEDERVAIRERDKMQAIVDRIRARRR